MSIIPKRYTLMVLLKIYMLRKLDLVQEKDKMKSLEAEMPEMKEVDVGSQETEKLKAYLKG